MRKYALSLAIFQLVINMPIFIRLYTLSLAIFQQVLVHAGPGPVLPS